MVSREVPSDDERPGSGGMPPGEWALPPPGFFPRGAVPLARALLGCLLVLEDEGTGEAGGVVVETEAYTEDDAASHSRSGPTERCRQMFGPGGCAYVYLIYGMHRCFNVTSGPCGSGEAVLVRALRPTLGLDAMAARRGRSRPEELCSGPGRLCQALGIGLGHNGHDLRRPPLRVLTPQTPPELAVEATGRIGITRDAHLRRRFVVAGSRFLSR
jgi:DNA-3-methyladenine glycosylase